ncbi:winged helix-turn-helix transcriptional regulator [Simplicispira suum]|uniref:winged helix-turn-helix transcriptional regulator n=1 Tax=Simplicispira suum TaxID=2109915 RepID=UPI001B808248|nr:winged helix-turn-helix domain-containing protein [Simplicispira suum]
MGCGLYDSAEPFDHTVLEMLWAPGADTVDKTSEEASEETSEETSSRVLALLRQSPTLSARQLAALLGLSQRAVELQLAKLKSAHRLKRHGPNKGGRWEVLP